MKLLHIDSSVLGPHSVSRKVSAAIVDRLRQATPGLQIVYRDLTATPLSHLTGSHLAVAQGAVAPDAALQQELAAGQAVLKEFVAADIVVLGAPMYNFTIPSQLKAWIDRVVISGKTFKYGAQGPEGLAGNKRVIIAISRGGFYGAGTPAAALEHLETYLRGVFGFIGVANPEFIFADGIQVGRAPRESAGERIAGRDQSPRGIGKMTEPAAVASRRRADVEESQNQPPCTPPRIAMRDANRPTPEKSAIKTSGWPLDFCDEILDAKNEMRAPFGMSAPINKVRKTPALERVIAAAAKVQAALKILPVDEGTGQHN
jgi:FMN-dependent NADH-azoreductase